VHIKIALTEKKAGGADGFFLYFNASTHKYVNTDGSKNLSVDGTGILPSVDENASRQILSFIKEVFITGGRFPLRLLDIGAGVGHLQRTADADAFFNAYSFEGCAGLINSFVCDKSRIAVCDMAKPGLPVGLKGAFHLTTSFEVLEHVHRSEMDTFFENLESVSDYHLCSIHCANQTDAQHCTIQAPSVWEDYFINRGISFVKLGNFPVTKNDNDFRDFTGLHNWDCSAMYLLRFNR
jgi:hypothetical protein